MINFPSLYLLSILKLTQAQTQIWFCLSSFSYIRPDSFGGRCSDLELLAVKMSSLSPVPVVLKMPIKVYLKNSAAMSLFKNRNPVSYGNPLMFLCHTVAEQSLYLQMDEAW